MFSASSYYLVGCFSWWLDYILAVVGFGAGDDDIVEVIGCLCFYQHMQDELESIFSDKLVLERSFQKDCCIG